EPTLNFCCSFHPTGKSWCQSLCLWKGAQQPNALIFYDSSSLGLFLRFPAPSTSSKRVVQENKHNYLLLLAYHYQVAEDVNVTFEDQQKINIFARNTNRVTELKDEIEVKKKQLQNLEDACEDLMMLEDSLLVPYQIGDVFISHSQEETQEMLEAAKKQLEEEIECLQSRIESIQQVLSDLKVQLYAKFGNNINLEADEN
uniref:Prefoldin subunit 4 n=1 Tax=Xenopus tropicalis TaxID=8364 RepID=A0A803K9M9_XENTR